MASHPLKDGEDKIKTSSGVMASALSLFFFSACGKHDSEGHSTSVPLKEKEQNTILCAGVFSLSGVVEVYRVTRRVELGIKATAVCSEKLQQLLKDISRVWNNLMGFMSLAKLAVRCSYTYHLAKSTSLRNESGIVVLIS